MSDMMDSPIETLPPNQHDDSPLQEETTPLPSTSQLIASAAASPSSMSHLIDKPPQEETTPLPSSSSPSQLAASTAAASHLIDKPPEKETTPPPSSVLEPGEIAEEKETTPLPSSPTPSAVQETGEIAEERDDRNGMRDDKDDDDRPVNRRKKRSGSRDYEDRSTWTSPSPRYRDRDYKRYARRSLSPPAHRERRSRSPSYKRSRWNQDDGYDRGRTYKRDKKDYKRYARRSLSPPAHRGRQSRSPSYKRSRWVDGGYGGRGDKRRNRSPSYEDGHQDSFQDKEAARGGAGSKSVSDTNLKSSTEGMRSYKQFTLLLEDDIEPSEAGRRYQEYSSEFISTQKKNFFELHKEEEWLKEKYHPLEVIERKRLELMTAKGKIDEAAVQALDRYVLKIGDEMFGCGAKDCTKLFSASKYVLKHLEHKHPDLVMELTAKVREDLYFENYMKDPNAPGSIPVIQKTIASRENDEAFGVQGMTLDS